MPSIVKPATRIGENRHWNVCNLFARKSAILLTHVTYYGTLDAGRGDEPSGGRSSRRAMAMEEEDADARRTEVSKKPRGRITASTGRSVSAVPFEPLRG